MFDLIDRLERLSPQAALPLLGVGGLFGRVAAWILFQLTLSETGPQGWAILGYLLGVLVCGWLAMIFAMVGARMRTGPRYPSVEEAFPSLPVTEYVAAIESLPRPLVSCGACRIVLEAHGDAGGCPRCGSSVDWYRVETDEDAALIVSVVGS